ncbi:hypothetical protein JB92DRAFT_2832891 [Gautieria morchelliformis]|nr:hypothetical protein JB92DRAFT_2832891 [Gautieria morchelliformis]
MIVFTPQFPTLLLLVAASRAASLPQRPASAPQISRSTPADLSALEYVRTYNTFRNMIFGRRSTPSPSNPDFPAEHSAGRNPMSKGNVTGIFGATSIPAPIPDSAKPASEMVSRNGTVVGHKPSVAPPAEFSESSERHSDRQHDHDGYGGPFNGHKGKQYSGSYDGHFRGLNTERYGGEEFTSGRREEFKDGHSRHEDKRDIINATVSLNHSSHDSQNLPAQPRVNSRLFARIGIDDLPTRLYVKKAVHDHDHGRRDLVDHVLGDGFEGSDTVQTRGIAGNGRHHARHWEDGPDVDAELLVERSHKAARLLRDQTKALLQTRKQHPLITHDVDHHQCHKHTTDHVPGKRDHRQNHEHEPDHNHIHEHVHKHVHGRRDSVTGAQN